jgi:hypothetical protein
MFGKAYDRDSGALVAIMAGPVNDEAEFARLLEAIRQLGADRGGQDAVCIVVVTPERPSLTAEQRQRGAQLLAGLGSCRLHLALVTRSPLARGVFTAISWVAPPPPHQHRNAYPSFEAAAAAMAKRVGRQLPALARLFGEARAALR